MLEMISNIPSGGTTRRYVEHTLNMRWTLIERARDIPLTGLRHRFDKIDTTRWPYSRGMNALTDPEIAEIAAKVGRPRSTNNGKIALDVDRIRAMRKAGFSWRQIADYLDVGVSTVRRRIQEGQSNLQASRLRWPL